jgi:ABC-type branched-subunit amino acid transport system substrate-binding protein
MVVASLLLAASLAAIGAGGSSASATPTATVEVIAPLTGTGGAYQPWVNAVVAAVKSENAHSAGNGAQIKLKICDSGVSANSEEGCGRQIVSDKAAGVLNMSSVATGIEPFLRQAHIPDFDFLVDKVMYTSPISYSVASLAPASDIGIATLSKRVGCKHLVMIRADLGGPAAAASYIQTFEADAQQVGVTADAVSATPGSPDMSPYVAQAISKGADCIYASAFGSDLVALLQAASQASSTVKLMTVPGYVTQATIQSLGSIMDRVLAVSFVWPATAAAKHPALKAFESDVKKYAPSPNALDNGSIASWAEARALITAIRKVKGSITAPKVIKVLNSFTNYNPGVAPPVSFSKPNRVAGASRIFAPYGLQVKWVGGQVYAVGSFFNLYTGKAVKG